MFNGIKKALKSAIDLAPVTNDSDVLLACNNDVVTCNQNSGVSASIQVGRNRGNTQKPLECREALRLIERHIFDFRTQVVSEYRANNGFVRLRVFSVNKNNVPELGNLTWSDMLDFSRENKTILSLREECKAHNIHCFVKEKAGVLTIICSSDEQTYKNEVDKVIAMYKM